MSSIQQRRQNLEELATLLENYSGPVKFNMATFLLSQNGEEISPYLAHSYNDCGTCACAVGIAAIHQIGQPRKHYYFLEYIYEDLTPESDLVQKQDVYDFLFNEIWPNDTKEAAARIRYYLAHGVPDRIDPDDKYVEQVS